MRLIVVIEKEYIAYKLRDNIEDESIELLFKDTALDIDAIVVSKLFELYKKYNDEIVSLKVENILRKQLPKPLGYYYDYLFKFNILWKDIMENDELVKEFLSYNLEYFERRYPEVNKKAENYISELHSG